MQFKHIITGLLLFSLSSAPLGVLAASLTVNMPGSNTAAQAMSVPWQQNSISLNQLQTLLNQNPGAQQLQIQFPNGTNWNVNPVEIQALYNQYAYKAKSLGYSQIPDVSFSSLQNAATAAGGQITIPIQNAMNGMESQMDSSLDQLHNKENEYRDQANSYLNMLPDWLRTPIMGIISAFVAIYNYICDKVSSWFG